MEHNIKINIFNAICVFLILQSNVLAFENIEKTYRFSAWILAIPIVITIAIVIFSIFIYIETRNIGAGILCLLLTLIPGGIFAPSMCLDTIRINSERIEQNKGFWFAQTTEAINYSDVEFIKLREEKNDNGLLNTIWEVNLKTGQRNDIDVGDLWDSNSKEIVEIMKGYKVNFK
jgi:hypothetical protein